VPNKFYKNFVLKDGRKVVLRELKNSDADTSVTETNKVISEGPFLYLNKKVTKKEEVEWIKSLLKNIKKKSAVNLAAFEGKRILGTVSLRFGKGRNSHVATMGIWIVKEYRSSGLAKLLFWETVKYAKKMVPQLKMINAGAFATNKRSLKFQKKLGFKKVGILKKDGRIGNRYVDTISMQLEL